MGNLSNIKMDDVKLTLQFEFIDEGKVKLSLVTIKKDLVYNYEANIGWNYYTNHKYRSKFCIWSTNTFLFDYDQLRLPDSKNLKNNISTITDFENDETRKKVLNRLFINLTNWSNHIDEKNIDNRVVIDNEYWYVT